MTANSVQITILTIDLAAVLRRRHPGKSTGQLTPRPRCQLVELTTMSGASPSLLLLDTNVYINRAAGRLAATVREAIDRALLFHCSVVLAELATGVANADPQRPDWPALRDHYGGLFAAVPASRLLTPDAGIWTEAGVIAGILARTQGFQRQQRKECLNDALIFLTAARSGIPVLTDNRTEFDLLQQLAPEGRFIHY